MVLILMWHTVGHTNYTVFAFFKSVYALEDIALFWLGLALWTTVFIRRHLWLNVYLSAYYVNSELCMLNICRSIVFCEILTLIVAYAGYNMWALCIKYILFSSLLTLIVGNVKHKMDPLPSQAHEDGAEWLIVAQTRSSCPNFCPECTSMINLCTLPLSI